MTEEIIIGSASGEACQVTGENFQGTGSPVIIWSNGKVSHGNFSSERNPLKGTSIVNLSYAFNHLESIHKLIFFHFQLKMKGGWDV